MNIFLLSTTGSKNFNLLQVSIIGEGIQRYIQKGFEAHLA
jgi:hypothetical protein